MKFFIVAFSVVFVIGAAWATVSEERKMKSESIIKECTQQLGIAPETMDKIRAGDWTDHSVEAKDMSKCFFTKSGFIDGDGNLNEPVLIERMTANLGDKQKAEQIFQDCKAKENVPKDEIPLNIYKCYLEAKAT